MSRLKQLGQCLEEKYFLSEQDGEKFVANLFEIIRERLLVDKIVKVKGLGTFKLAEMNARESVNVNTGERITIEGRYKLTFTPENAVRDRINSPFASFESIDMDEEIDFSSIDQKYESTEELVEEEPAAVEPVVEPVVVEPAAEPKAAETVTVEPIAVEPAVEVVKPLVELAEEEPTVSVEEEPVVSAESVEPAEPVALVESVAEESASVEEPVAEEPVVQEEPEEENQEAPEVETPVTELEEEKNTNAGATAVRAPICEELIRKDMNHNQTIITLLRWVLALVILVLLCLGGYVLYNVGREKGAMEMEYYLHQHSVESEDARMAERAALELVDEDSVEVTKPKHDISLIKTPKKEEEKPVAKEEPAAKPAETKVAEKPVPAPAKPVAQPAKPTTQPAKPAAQPTKPVLNAYDAYNNKDARVRTGAYNIVGVQETITVREGQTLKSISKFYLGDGMECYIEAFNGGKTSFAAGEKVRIPKLELKKKSQK